VLENSPDEVINIINEDNIHLESLDPNTIILNDGRNNLERITAYEADVAKNSAASPDHTKPAKTGETTEVNGGDHGDRKKTQRQKKYDGMSSSNNETPSEASNDEDSLELDLSNQKLLAVDMSYKGSVDKETSDESSSEEETSNDETSEKVLSDETKTGPDE